MARAFKRSSRKVTKKTTTRRRLPSARRRSTNVKRRSSSVYRSAFQRAEEKQAEEYMNQLGVARKRNAAYALALAALGLGTAAMLKHQHSRNKKLNEMLRR